MVGMETRTYSYLWKSLDLLIHAIVDDGMCPLAGLVERTGGGGRPQRGEGVRGKGGERRAGLRIVGVVYGLLGPGRSLGRRPCCCCCCCCYFGDSTKCLVALGDKAGIGGAGFVTLRGDGGEGSAKPGDGPVFGILSILVGHGLFASHTTFTGNWGDLR